MLFKVTFNLDGTGLLYNPAEPIHLDALLAWCLAPRQRKSCNDRGVSPKTANLPLLRNHVCGEWVWAASALFPEGPTGEDLQFWRKRFRQSRADLTTGSPNLKNGTYRDWQTPYPVFLALKMVAYASGSRKAVKRILKEVRYLGKKTAYGYGKIVSMEFDEIQDDWTMYKDGLTTRFLPDLDGHRLVRPRPPYWHPMGRVQCRDVGSAQK